MKPSSPPQDFKELSKTSKDNTSMTEQLCPDTARLYLAVDAVEGVL